MNDTDSLDALRRANPRRQAGFARMASELSQAAGTPRPATFDLSRGRPGRSPRAWRPRPAVGVPAAVIAVVVAAVSPSGRPTARLRSPRPPPSSGRPPPAPGRPTSRGPCRSR